MLASNAQTCKVLEISHSTYATGLDLAFWNDKDGQSKECVEKYEKKVSLMIS